MALLVRKRPSKAAHALPIRGCNQRHAIHRRSARLSETNSRGLHDRRRDVFRTRSAFKLPAIDTLLASRSEHCASW